MAPLVLIMMLLMILTGGIAVDVMRFESRRVAVQNTLDRATLAVANMTQTLATDDQHTTRADRAEAIVDDYFAKANLQKNLEFVRLDEGLNFRVVEARAHAVSQNFFMSMLDIPFLRATNVSRAEQRVTNVEIALVLDISGSMVYDNTTRIANLKSAARDFIDAVLANDQEDKISISIVPYNGQVNLGPELMAAYNVTQKHTTAASYCVDIPAASYNTTGLSQTQPMPQVPFVDSFTSSPYTLSASFRDVDPPQFNQDMQMYTNMWCVPNTGNYVRVHANDATVLKDHISGLNPVGATSIDLGMKWGTVLLDPGTRPVISRLVSRDVVPAYFSTRPADFGDRETMKVIVLMTDGANFEDERINDNDYRVGNSPIWYSNSGGRFSIFKASRLSSGTSSARCTPFWVAHLREWHSRPWTGSTPQSNSCYSAPTGGIDAYSVSGATRQTWDEVWKRATMQWVAYQLYALPAHGTSTNNSVQTQRRAEFDRTMNEFRTKTPISSMNARLSAICGLAKTQGIVVFSIAFEAPSSGQDALRDCASEKKSEHYYYISADNRGMNIRTAFNLIASNLSLLRLTQ